MKYNTTSPTSFKLYILPMDSKHSQVHEKLGDSDSSNVEVYHVGELRTLRSSMMGMCSLMLKLKTDISGYSQLEIIGFRTIHAQLYKLIYTEYKIGRDYLFFAYFL
jgi:hypothetical protein